MSEMLTEQAKIAKSAAIKVLDAKQMDAVATQIYTRR